MDTHIHIHCYYYKSLEHRNYFTGKKYYYFLIPDFRLHNLSLLNKNYFSAPKPTVVAVEESKFLT